MNQDQQSRPWWKDTRFVWVSAALTLAGLVIITILGYLLIWEWTGLVGIPENPETRTAWDWLELLIIPLVLALGALWFNNQARKSEQVIAQRETENDRAIAEDRAREDALQRYLDRMSELVLDKKLRESERDDATRVTARARTLTVLRSLDGNRKSQVARFLHEADLIGKVIKVEAIIDLRTADLNAANLNGANLNGANLSEASLSEANLIRVDLRDGDLSFANLNGANLSFANLKSANLSGANLSGANLNAADLNAANLNGANLGNANLSNANLRDVHLSPADLTHADLSFANLTHANLSFANLSGAKNWTNRQLTQALSLIGAALPDGTLMTAEAWEEFKKRYGQ